MYSNGSPLSPAETRALRRDVEALVGLHMELGARVRQVLAAQPALVQVQRGVNVDVPAGDVARMLWICMGPRRARILKTKLDNLDRATA
jgi:hypothetical protein